MGRGANVQLEELEIANRQIESYVKELDYFKRPYDEVVYYLLVAHEFIYHKSLYGTTDASDLLSSDDLKKSLNRCLYWAREYSNPPNFLPARTTDLDKVIVDATDLLKIGNTYQSFYCAYQCCKMGYNYSYSVHKGGSIDFDTDSHFMAHESKWLFISNYMDSQKTKKILESTDQSVTQLLNRIALNLETNDDNLERISVSLVRELSTVLRPIEMRELLPTDWAYRNTSIECLRCVYNYINALAVIGLYKIRSLTTIVPSDGGEFTEIPHPIFWLTKSLLIQSIHSAFPEHEPDNIGTSIQLMIFDRNLNRPDPGVTPLIPLYHDSLILAPSLVHTSSFERNLLFVISKNDTNALSEVSKRVEKWQLVKISSALIARGFSVFLQRKLNLDDNQQLEIDLLIMSPDYKYCIVAQAKAVIGPAEAYEQKSASSREIEASKQAVDCVHAIKNRPSLLADMTGNSRDSLSACKIAPLVFLQGYTGSVHEACETVPTLESDFFLRILENGVENSVLERLLLKGLSLPEVNSNFRMRRAQNRLGSIEFSTIQFMNIEGSYPIPSTP